MFDPLKEKEKEEKPKHPKWQKARIVYGDDFPHLKGKEIWVVAERPHPFVGVNIATHQFANAPALTTNIKRENGVQVVVSTICVELLPEFADIVPALKWEEFTKTEQPN